MHGQSFIHTFQKPLCHLTQAIHMHILYHYRIHMDYQENPQLFCCFSFNPVNHLMRHLDIYITRNLGMNGSHAAAGSIVVNNQVMASHNSFILINEVRDLLINLRINRLSNQWFQSILRNIKTGNYNQHRNHHSYQSVNIHMPDSEYRHGQNGR